MVEKNTTNVYFSFKVNTKRERRSSNNKSHHSKQSSLRETSLPVLVTTMSDEHTHAAAVADTLVIKPTSIEINNGHHHHHSTEKSPRILSSPSHIEPSVDSGQSSDISHVEGGEKSKKNIHSDETDHHHHRQARESSPTSGVIIPEEKRVTDRVKVFEAVANNNEKSMVKNGTTTTKKKSSMSNSFSTADQKQISPTSTSESFESQSMNEMKLPKNKSKKSSLKKQIQNLLKIEKPSIQDDLNAVDEHINGKKNKKDPSKINEFVRLKIRLFQLNSEIQ